MKVTTIQGGNRMLNNKEFYPTPTKLIQQLIGTDRIEGPVLEPSAGKGNIIQYLRNQNRNIDIYAIEKDVNLRNLLLGQGETVVWDDFLTYETPRQYGTIVMNPPFSNGDKHLLKAISLAENVVHRDTTIYAILNENTLKNTYSKERKQLEDKLNYYNADVRYVSNAFTESERKTDVGVALIKLVIRKRSGKSMYESIIHKKIKSDESSVDHALTTVLRKNAVGVSKSKLDRLLEEYSMLVSKTLAGHQLLRERNALIDYTNQLNKRDKYDIGVRLNLTYDDEMDKELDTIRRVYWDNVLNLEEFTKLLTQTAIQEFRASISEFKQFELNKENVLYVLQAFASNSTQILEDTVVKYFDDITRHSQRESFSKNIHLYTGWYTNSAYKINTKYIYPLNFRDMYSWSNRGATFEDLSWEVKSYISDLDKIIGLFAKVDTYTSLGNNEYENSHIRFKLFQKGTIHVWFKNKDILDQINIVAGRYHKWLPSEEEEKTNKDAKEYMEREFSSYKVLTN